MGSFSGYSSNVLTIKNFPLLFNDTDRKEFLEHFGAVRLRCLTRFKNTSNVIIADFGSKTHASQALLRLHQLEILARRLSVEYCPLELAYLAFTIKSPLDTSKEDPFLHGLSPGKNQIHYSLPSDRLSYSYPAIDDTILTNISNALWSVPAFYTQVLHLMNKMSLPCPMSAGSTKTSRSLSKSSVACQTDESTEVINMDTDDDESEIDDGAEEKRVKRSRRRYVLPTSTPQTMVSGVHINETTVTEKRQRPTIELRLPHSLDRSRLEDSTSTSTDTTIYGFGQLQSIQSIISPLVIVTPVSEQLPPLPPISLEELTKHRLSEDQLRLIDNGRLYRNYERGQPSRRLYIKNIDIKYVDERMLHSIYDRYQLNASPIDIRLMREGKMKGQAFVTFDSEETALHALNETNGFVLHEKPLIVQFARTAKPKDTV